jgi:hypothetical protein
LACGPPGIYDENTTYYVKFDDGRSEFSGDIAEKAKQILRAYDIRDVHLGSGGAYFIRYRINGVDKISYKNLPKEVEALCSN